MKLVSKRNSGKTAKKKLTIRERKALNHLKLVKTKKSKSESQVRVEESKNAA